MLKIDIRVGETVAIGDDVLLRLESKSGQLARLAIRASPALKIQRIPGIPDAPIIKS